MTHQVMNAGLHGGATGLYSFVPLSRLAGFLSAVGGSCTAFSNGFTNRVKLIQVVKTSGASAIGALRRLCHFSFFSEK